MALKTVCLIHSIGAEKQSCLPYQNPSSSRQRKVFLAVSTTWLCELPKRARKGDRSASAWMRGSQSELISSLEVNSAAVPWSGAQEGSGSRGWARVPWCPHPAPQKLTGDFLHNAFHHNQPRKKSFQTKSKTKCKAMGLTLWLIYLFLPSWAEKVNIRATPWQTFKGNSSDTDVNQCSLCEHITWQKLAFCNPLKPSRQNKKEGGKNVLQTKGRGENKERVDCTLFSFIGANGSGAFIH